MEGNVELSHNLDDLRCFGRIFIKKRIMKNEKK